jgi:hypothetical protein
MAESRTEQLPGSSSHFQPCITTRYPDSAGDDLATLAAWNTTLPAFDIKVL